MSNDLQMNEKARGYWERHGMDSYDYVLLLPDGDLGQNARIRAAFERKLDGRRGIAVDGEAAHWLLSLYSLYAFTGKLIIGSFTAPHGRKLRNLLDTGTAPEEILINDVILGAM